MGVWYHWCIDIPKEKEEEAREIIKRRDLEKVIEVSQLSGHSAITLEVIDEVISQHSVTQAGEALKELAKLLPGTDLDGQTFEIRYEGDDNDAYMIDGKVLYLELLSVEKGKKGIEVTMEARELDDGPITRYIGTLAEEGS